MHAAGQDGKDLSGGAMLWNKEAVVVVLCVFERSDLCFIGTQQEPNRPREEMKRRVRRRSGAAFVLKTHSAENVSDSCTCSYSNSCVWQNKELSARGIPANRGATRRGVARRAAASSEEERACVQLPFPPMLSLLQGVWKPPLISCSNSPSTSNVGLKFCPTPCLA